MGWGQAEGCLQQEGQAVPSVSVPRGHGEQFAIRCCPRRQLSDPGGATGMLLAIAGTCCAQWAGREITRHTPQTPTKGWGPR